MYFQALHWFTCICCSLTFFLHFSCFNISLIISFWLNTPCFYDIFSFQVIFSLFINQVFILLWLYIVRKPSVVVWLSALSFEMCRDGSHHRIYGLYERVLGNDMLNISVLHWVLWMEHWHDPSASRRIFICVLDYFSNAKILFPLPKNVQKKNHCLLGVLTFDIDI